MRLHARKAALLPRHVACTRPRTMKWLALASLGLVAACSSKSENTCGQGSQALTVCAGQNTVKGLDVSYYDGTIDWTKVKASHGFAIARISDGTGFMDPKFSANWA